MKKILAGLTLLCCNIELLPAQTASTETPGSSASIPNGYYNSATGLTCGPLKTALFNIISSNTTVLSYSPGTWNAVATTDMHRNDANTADVVWDMYSDNPTGPEAFYFTYGTDQCGSYSGQGDCYNREHSFPQAWFVNGTYPMYSDLNHIFPTDGFTNGKHDNNPYSEVATATWTSTNGSKLGSNSFPGFTGTVFEPINAYKGDFARATLYMVTRYQSDMVAWKNNSNADDILSGNTYPSLDDWYIKLCYKWHTQDPVSAKEIARNDAVYALQGNRNPYIDHPEYVALVWQCTGLLPVTLLDFQATKYGTGVTLNWSATQESGFSHYEIERSTNGSQFNQIARISGTNRHSYNMADNQLPSAKTVYYRLKMVDIDGQFKYSKIVPVKLFNASGALLFPNPAQDQLGIKLQQSISRNSAVQVLDATGRIVLRQTIQATSTNSVELDIRHLAPGRYLIQINSNNDWITDSFIKTR